MAQDAGEEALRVRTLPSVDIRVAERVGDDLDPHLARLCGVWGGRADRDWTVIMIRGCSTVKGCSIIRGCSTVRGFMAV